MAVESKQSGPAPAGRQGTGEPGPCPLCGQQLYGWIALPAIGEPLSVGAPVEGDPRERVIDRCESCGVALEREREVDLADEWEAVCTAGDPGTRRISIPNRVSLQAWIGAEGWAAIDLYPGRLIHTAASLELLAGHNRHAVAIERLPLSRRAQGWMWQTLLNGLTFHPNFAREVRAGRLRLADATARWRFVVDGVVTVLGAPLVLLVSAPLELGAALARRAGELTATARRVEPAEPAASP
jgi:hypothetical protein